MFVVESRESTVLCDRSSLYKHENDKKPMKNEKAKVGAGVSFEIHG